MEPTILNAYTIYKQGGGSGLKNGGTLTENQWILIESGNVYNINNSSQSEINFYFKPKDGEVLNAVIEFENNANCDINVFYENSSGFLIPLYCVGTNNVTSGKYYTICIIDNTYYIDEATGGCGEPEFIDFGDDLGIKKIVKIGTRIWTASDFGPMENFFAISSIVEKVGGGWRLPNYYDIDYQLIPNAGTNYEKIRSISGWPNNQGTNETGFNASPQGWYNPFFHAWYNTTSWTIPSSDNNNAYVYSLFDDGHTEVTQSNKKESIFYWRMCRDA